MARSVLTPEQRDHTELAGAIDAIWTRSRDAIMSRVDLIEAAATSLVAASLTESDRLEAQRAAHRLAGTVGTFGFHTASSLARDIEIALDSHALDEPSTVLHIAERAVALRDALRVETRPTAARSDHRAPPYVTESSRSTAVVAWLVGADEDRLDAIAVAAAAYGAHVLRRSEATLPDDGANARVPDVLFLSPSPDAEPLSIGPAYANVISQLTAWRSRHPQVLTIVLESLEPCDMRTRVAIADAEAFGPVPRQVDADELWRFVYERLLERGIGEGEHLQADGSEGARAVVLLVTDDTEALRSVSDALRPLGHELVTQGDPFQLWESIQRSRPDLLVLDMDMPGIDGLTLTRLMRQDARWSHLPIVVLADNATSARAAQARETGADDVLPKSMPSALIRRRVNRHLARATTGGRAPSNPALLRVATRPKMLDLLTREINLADRSSLPICAVLLRLESAADAASAPESDTVPPATLQWLSQQLSRARRVGETAIRVSLDTVLLTWRGVKHAEAEVRLNALSQAWQASAGISHNNVQAAYAITFGLVERTSAHADARDLLRETERALWHAPVGRPEIADPSDNAATGLVAPRRVGVALIEDDPALAELLELTLGAAGYRVCRWSDGDDVTAALCGPAPSVLARVILLDINLPSVDGLTLLRRFGASGVLRQSRVIVMSVRANEAEMLQAFALGAFDFVAKPLSVPVLMQRVQRAIAA